MKSKVLQYLVLSYIIIFPFVRSQSQENKDATSKLISINVESALEESYNNNKQILIDRYEIEKARANQITASLRPNPFLQLNADIFPMVNGKIDPSQQQYGAFLGYQFETAGKREARMGLAAKSFKVSEYLFADSVRRVFVAVVSAYFDCFATKEKLDLANENYLAFQSIVEINKKRLSKQDISQLEFIRSEVSRDNYAVQLIEATLAHEEARTRLSVLLARDPSLQEWSIAESIDSEIYLPETDYAKDFDFAKTNRPDFQALVSSKESAKANEQLQRALAVPDIIGQLDAMNQTKQQFYGATITFALPIFARNQGEIEKSRMVSQQVTFSMEAAELELKKEIYFVVRELQVRYQALINTKKNSLEKSKDAIRIMDLAYRAGGSTFYDLLETRRSYNENKLLFIDSFTAYKKAFYFYRFSLGLFAIDKLKEIK
jgi:cobalt-zinc-cadmium efflux system outer membrane protein